MGQDKSWEGGPKRILKGHEQLAKVVDFDVVVTWTITQGHRI